MHNSFLIMLATNTILIDLVHSTLTKLHMKFQPLPLKIFWEKVEKVQKTHWLFIIMLINPSLYDFLEKIIDLQIIMIQYILSKFQVDQLRDRSIST